MFFYLFLGFLLRIFNLNQSLWLDEAIGAIAVRGYSFYAIITNFIKGDNHPPLYYLLLDLWTSVFGYSEISLRMPSVIFGILTIFYTYKIAVFLSNSKKSFLSFGTLLIFITSPLHIYYSQEARMYSLLVFLSVFSIYYFLVSLRERWFSSSFILFSLGYVLLFFTDYVAIFIYPIFFLCLFFIKPDKKWFQGFLILNLFLFLLFYLYLPIFSFQLEGGRWLLKNVPLWKRVAGGASIKNLAVFWAKFVFGRITFADKISYLLLILFISIPYLLGLFNAFEKKNYFLWVWFLTPLFLGFVFSFFLPVFIYFRFIFLLPPFYLLTVEGLSKIKDKRAFFLYILIFSNLLSFSIYIFDKKQQRERWREAVFFIEERLKNDEIVLFENSEPFAPYRWYSRKADRAFGALDSLAFDVERTRERIKNFVKDQKGVYYFVYLRDINDPNSIVSKNISDLGFEKKEVFSFEGIGEVIYFKKD